MEGCVRINNDLRAELPYTYGRIFILSYFIKPTLSLLCDI